MMRMFRANFGQHATLFREYFMPFLVNVPHYLVRLCCGVISYIYTKTNPFTVLSSSGGSGNIYSSLSVEI